MEKDQGLRVRSIAQYVKSVLLENNKTKQELLNLSLNKSNVDFKLATIKEKLSEDIYRVIIQLEVVSKLEGGEQLFKIVLEYAGEYQLIGNVGEEIKEEILLINLTTLLFPFARQEIAQLCISGGYPAVLLDTVDFRNAYLASKKQQKIAENKEQSQIQNDSIIYN